MSKAATLLLLLVLAACADFSGRASPAPSGITSLNGGGAPDSKSRMGTVSMH